MHEVLIDIPERILGVARGALSQAVHHAIFSNPGAEYWEEICILNAAHAGELFIKAIVASEHPLLIFRELLSVDDMISTDLDIKRLIERGRTYDFKDLPRLLWITTGQRLPDPASFNKIMNTRNAIQHFCAPDEDDLRGVALEFIFKNIDPLICSNFGLYAIEHHEDHNIGYDYVVEHIISRELDFSIPDNFSVGEFDLAEILATVSAKYRNRLNKRLRPKGLERS